MAKPHLTPVEKDCDPFMEIESPMMDAQMMATILAHIEVEHFTPGEAASIVSYATTQIGRHISDAQDVFDAACKYRRAKGEAV